MMFNKAKRIQELEERLETFEGMFSFFVIHSGGLDKIMESMITKEETEKDVHNDSFKVNIEEYQKPKRKYTKHSSRKKPLHKKRCPVCPKKYKGTIGVVTHIRKAHPEWYASTEYGDWHNVL